MNRPLVIGITGGIGSGKSTLATMLRNLGYPVYDTDREARRLQNEHSQLVSAISSLFGNAIYQNGALNRPVVAERVFSNPSLLQQLTELVHPVVKADFLQWISQQEAKIVFIESAVLLEGKFDSLTDSIIVVTASEDIRIQRVMQRDGISPEHVKARMQHQLPEEEKIKRADKVIYTDNGLKEEEVKRVIGECMVR